MSAAAKSNVIHVAFGAGGHRLREADARALYQLASEIDEDPATWDEAERLYRRAVAIDPLLAIAWSNLGNILFRRGDDKAAEEMYRHALSLDGNVSEAHYNLGYVMLERGDAKVAAEHLERSLAIDPAFADAHYNLAEAYEQLGDRAQSRPHWKRYLELNPQGAWAQRARNYVMLTPKEVGDIGRPAVCPPAMLPPVGPRQRPPVQLSLGNNETVTLGVVPDGDGWLALTYTKSRRFKTRDGADRWFARQLGGVAFAPKKGGAS